MRVASLFAVAAFSFASAAAVVAYIGGVPVGADVDAAPADLTGQLLVAAPDMDDPTFQGTRIYLVHHDAHGAVGVVVNGPDVGAVYGVDLAWGGPVGERQLIVLHDSDAWAGAVVEEGVVVSGHEPALMQALVHRRGPAHSRVFVGYAGWGPGQLERELQAGAWSVVDVDGAALFR